jgi:porphobilinogen synthase
MLGSSRGSFPQTRMRRNRQYPWLRQLVREHRLTVDDLIWPLFVCEGRGREEPVASLPGVSRWSVDRISERCRLAVELGIPAVAIFPATPPGLKTDDGREALNVQNLVCQAVASAKDAVGDRLGVICDVALDPYTSHGHDGLLRNGKILNDETIEILGRQAVIQARAGCDVIAPSDMMDGRIGAVRAALDANGYSHIVLLSYAAKYASGFYGPFRDAVGSASSLGKSGKHTYQMDPANTDEALHEVALDLQEGADLVMVKPGMPYLDIVRRVADQFAVPTFVYQVSGEYAMLAAAAERGWLDRQTVVLESLLAFKRAGAAAVLTYFAPEVAGWLKHDLS